MVLASGRMPSTDQVNTYYQEKQFHHREPGKGLQHTHPNVDFKIQYCFKVTNISLKMTE